MKPNTHTHTQMFYSFIFKANHKIICSPTEQIVLECFSAPPPQDTYTRMSMMECSVSDSEKRSLVRIPDSMELTAVMLQGGSECRKGNQKVLKGSRTETKEKTLALTQSFPENQPVCFLPSVNLNMSTYVHLDTNVNAQTVALGIRGTNFFLSCHKEGDDPTLHLEVKKTNILSSY